MTEREKQELVWGVLAEIGEDRIAASIDGIRPNAIRGWRTMSHGRASLIPAIHYDALEKLAGRPLPREAFTFKPLKSAPDCSL